MVTLEFDEEMLGTEDAEEAVENLLRRFSPLVAFFLHPFRVQRTLTFYRGFRFAQPPAIHIAPLRGALGNGGHEWAFFVAREGDQAFDEFGEFIPTDASFAF